MVRTEPIPFLPRSPLVVVLGQVRFSPVLVMERYVPDIQNELSRAGFPLYRAGSIEEVRWNFTSEGAAPSIETESHPRWEFSNPDFTWRILLTHDTLTLATSAYVTYAEPFERFLRIALSMVDRRAALQLITRLGLRYVDLVEPDPGLSFADYLRPHLLPLVPEEIGLKEAIPYVQIVGLTDIGQIIIRSVRTNSGQSLPPDLTDLGLRNTRVVPAGKFVAILDFDHFTAAEAPFDVDTTLVQLAALHDHLDVAFRESVTPEALALWGAPAARTAASSRRKGAKR
jgi:uncharacterized protein (TIGR04255 family)